MVYSVAQSTRSLSLYEILYVIRHARDALDNLAAAPSAAGGMSDAQRVHLDALESRLGELSRRIVLSRSWLRLAIAGIVWAVLRAHGRSTASQHRPSSPSPRIAAISRAAQYGAQRAEADREPEDRGQLIGV